ncbi:hypothetical protein [Lacrimispora sp. 210928-DFI.3.58]|uniref:hypothetical protein n=1 Tax=Lacrimispora sp. 210928-DFI.3.58 TaxID=2883214 RepID=UPI001D061101|nr:hypothetical protein [Lacrimispora sp. 210928-DFI.3.58]MCB7318860.1 hypothetical protein [Lacrimispora sp. 210928-DFI.3.58]
MKKHPYRIAAAIAAAVVLAAGCGKKTGTEATEPTTAAQAESSVTETTKAAEPTEPVDSSEEQLGETAYYMLQGTVKEVAEDGLSFELAADDGETYKLKLSDIRDVETDIEKDKQIAIACVTETGDHKDAVMVVALPEQEEWSFEEVSGETTANAMSTFTLKTEGGQELSFMKDNCPIEEGALNRDSGDQVRVTYISALNSNFPIMVEAL